MERKIVNKLIEWKNNPSRQPLIITGARQVGKTYSALMFGKEYYKNTVYLNMEDNLLLQNVFERDLNSDRIIREISVLSCQSIIPNETLIIFDAIHANLRAQSSLKNFNNDISEYHIIALSSLPDVLVNKGNELYPSGDVDTLKMYPLDFEEFLVATGNTTLIELIKECYQKFSPLSVHEKALDLYKTYLIVGGMPRAVQEYIRTNDFNFVIATQKAINDAYIADMAKYATTSETTKIMAAWASIPAQLSKENKKFQYKVIKSGARAYEYETPLDWLRFAGIINKCVRISEGKLPLAAYADNDSFKVYMMDTGLLCSKFGIAPNVILSGLSSFDGFKGALAENYVCQSLVVNGFTPYYWASPGKAELDFVLQDSQGNVIPLEVKSSDNVRAKSMSNFVSLYKSDHAIRVSTRNFGFENGIKSIPLYAVFCLMP